MLHIFAAGNVRQIPVQTPSFVPFAGPVVPLRENVTVVVPDDLVERPFERALDIEVNAASVMDDQVAKEVDTGCDIFRRDLVIDRKHLLPVDIPDQLFGTLVVVETVLPSWIARFQRIDVGL